MLPNHATPNLLPEADASLGQMAEIVLLIGPETRRESLQILLRQSLKTNVGICC